MKKLNVREVREALTHLDEVLAREGEITITRRGIAIARLVSVTPRRPMPSHRDLRQSMRRMKRGSEDLLREDRDAR